MRLRGGPGGERGGKGVRRTMRACALRSIRGEKGRGWSEASSVTPAWKRRKEARPSA